MEKTTLARFPLPDRFSEWSILRQGRWTSQGSCRVLQERNASCLLSRETSTRLGMLHVAASTTTELPPVNDGYQSLLQTFPAVFSGKIGKLLRLSTRAQYWSNCTTSGTKYPLHPYTTVPGWKPNWNSLKIKISLNRSQAQHHGCHHLLLSISRMVTKTVLTCTTRLSALHITSTQNLKKFYRT